MKILCKLVPESDICCTCIDDQLDGRKEKLECYDCLERSPDYEVLQFGHSLFIGDWAMVMLDGKVERVKLDRVKRVRTVYVENCMGNHIILGKCIKSMSI